MSKRNASLATRTLLIVLALGVSFFSLRKLELAEALESLLLLGPSVFVIFVPALLGLSAETIGFREALRQAGYRAGFVPLLQVRGATEALSVFLPGGTVVGESAKPLLLLRLAELPISVGVGSTAYRKYLRVLTHGALILVAAALGHRSLELWSYQVIGRPGASFALAAIGVILLACALFSATLLRTGGLAARCFDILGERLSSRAAAHLAGYRRHFLATDDATRLFFGLPLSGSVVPLALCLCAWMLESFEAYVILRLLDQEVSFPALLAVDVGVSLLRQLLVILPGGVGIQELGYLSGLTVLSLNDPLATGAAFLILKRAREVVQGALFLLVFLTPTRKNHADESVSNAIPKSYALEQSPAAS